MGAPLVGVSRSHLAKHSIDEPCSALSAARFPSIAGQLARGINCRVIGHAHIEDLVRAHAQNVLEIILDVIPIPRDTCGEHEVIPALHSQGAKGKLGRKGRILAR
jgi:hypothetical protein